MKAKNLNSYESDLKSSQNTTKSNESRHILQSKSIASWTTNLGLQNKVSFLIHSQTYMLLIQGKNSIN